MNRPFAVPEIALDRANSSSLRQQIHAQLSGAIRQGKMPTGARLPSSRLLAKMLGVSRNTVVEAYEQLLEDGLAVTKMGSGIRISHAATNPFPNFSNLRKTARAAHYPLQTIQVEDPDGTALYLNPTRPISR